MDHSAVASLSSSQVVHHKHDVQTGVHYIILDRVQARNAISQQLLLELEGALKIVLGHCATGISLGLPSSNSSPCSQRGKDDTSFCSTEPTTALGKCAEELQSRTSSIFKSMPQLTRLSHDKPVPARCVIIQSSSTTAFCAGADLKERKNMSSEEVVHFLANLRRVIDQIAVLPIPTIAAIEGPALGGGLELALACDFRVARASSQATVGFPECRLGIIPGAGGTQRAPRLIGLSRAKELVFTGRLLTAREAYDWGMIDYLCQEGRSVSDQARCLAEQMLHSAPLALASAKASITFGFDMDIDQALSWENSCYKPLLSTLDREEALKAFSEKRKPIFVGQ